MRLKAGRPELSASAGCDRANEARARSRFLLSATVLLLNFGVGLPAAALEAWPNVSYDPEIPTLHAVVGHELGADITAPADLHRYLEALAAAAPRRTRLVEYARSWEGRPLHYLVIGSAASIGRLDEIRAGIAQLADPRGVGSAERERLVADLPVTVWLAHGVHGDEISSSDAALLTAYHLLAAQDDTAALLNDTLVVIDPSQNPDGRARFVQHYRSLRGPTPQPSPIAAERSQPWPSGRTNHYLFDMNRDWFALTQPEVRGRVGAFLEYYPLVYVDLHEMGTDSSYYFPPPAVPYNPYLTDSQRGMLRTLGRGIADAFDRFGFRYYTREVYDAYYPGYGDTWPALHGAAGMTFEMASAVGLMGQRSDGSLVTYVDGVRRHFTASLATVRTAAGQRRQMLQAFVEQRSASGDDTVYLLARTRDPGRADKLANLLIAQGVEVRQLPEAARVCGARHEAGTYLVSTDQPAGRLAGTLLAAESPAAESFWAEQERRAAKRLPVEVYDVVAWSLPLLFDVPVASCAASVGAYPVVEGQAGGPAAEPGDAAVAYLVPWGTQAAARLLAAALQDGLHLEVATETLTHDGEVFPRGTLILRRSANDDDLPQRMAELAEATRARIKAADRSWVDAGIDLGSERVRTLAAPRVALAWDEPTAVTSAGAWRYLLEQKVGYPVAPVRVRDLGSRWLDQFDVLVLPEGEGYEKALGEDGGANLERWVRRGGTLIAVGSGLEYLAGIDLLSVRPEWRALPEDGPADETSEGKGAESEADGPQQPAADAGEADHGNDHGRGHGKEDPSGPVAGSIIRGEAEYRDAIRPEEERPEDVPGVLVRAAVDADHWLSAGLPDQLPFMITGHHVFTPIRLDKGTNVATFVDADSLVAGGHLWQAARRQLAHKPALIVQSHDRGQVIGFAADPSFRGMMDGLDVLVANAVFFGPAASGAVPPPPPLPRPALR